MPKKNEPKNTGDEFDTRGGGRGGYRGGTLIIGSCPTVPEERKFIREIEKMVDETTYEFILKVTRIYALNIITKNEAF